MSHCSQYSAISRDYIYTWSWYLRHRTGYSGQVGVHGGRHSEHFNSTFWSQCGNIVNRVYLEQPKNIAYVGDIGAGYCKSGYHGSARALDISQIGYTDGTYIDTNYSWRGTTQHRRWYLGLAAQCRRFVGTVLTAWYNSDHQNHIHIDNGVGFVPVRTSARSDTVLIQAVCNIMVGDGTTIDGVWGSQTEAAYNRLRTQMGVCGDPKTNINSTYSFFGLIAAAGLNGRYAGAPGYQGSC